MKQRTSFYETDTNIKVNKKMQGRCVTNKMTVVELRLSKVYREHYLYRVAPNSKLSDCISV